MALDRPGQEELALPAGSVVPGREIARGLGQSRAPARPAHAAYAPLRTSTCRSEKAQSMPRAAETAHRLALWALDVRGAAVPTKDGASISGPHACLNSDLAHALAVAFLQSGAAFMHDEL